MKKLTLMPLLPKLHVESWVCHVKSLIQALHSSFQTFGLFCLSCSSINHAYVPFYLSFPMTGCDVVAHQMGFHDFLHTAHMLQPGTSVHYTTEYIVTNKF